MINCRDMFLPLWGIHSGLALETEKKDVFSSRKGKSKSLAKVCLESKF